MPKRRPTTNDDASQIFEALHAPAVQPAPPLHLPNPAELAATCLLETLVTQHPLPFTASELVILSVPDESWIAIVKTMIKPVVYGGVPPSNDRSDDFSNFDDPVSVYRGSQFYGRQFDARLSNELSTELLHGQSVWLVTETAKTSEEGLPPVLVASADRQLVLPEFSTESYGKFLEMVTGTAPLQSWHPSPLEELTPTVLRVSARQHQTADEYAQRIAKIVEAKRESNMKNGEKKPSAPTTALRLSELHGMREAVQWGQSLAMDLKDYKEGILSWAEVERGCLFWGPTGSGKTSLVKAISQHCGVSFFASSYSVWQSSGSGHLGNVITALRKLFSDAKEAAPSIICIEEIDSITTRGDNNHRGDWWRAIINALLEQLDGLDGREGVVVIGTSNFPNAIDPAIRRPGRLDRQIYVGLPDDKALAKIYQHYLGNNLPPSEFDKLAGVSLGYSGADVERAARGARRRARRERRDVTFDDVFQEIVGDLPPPGDRSLFSTAIHEASHAAAMLKLTPGRLRLVSIAGGGNSAGRTIGLPDREGDTTAESINQRLIILLAGRAGEEVILGHGTAGCGGNATSDLAHATHTAFLSEVSLGLGASGLLWSEPPQMEDLHARFLAQPAAAQAARLRIEKSFASAKEIVTQSRELIEAIAEELLDKYVLTAEQLAPILAAHPVIATSPPP